MVVSVAGGGHIIGTGMGGQDANQLELAALGRLNVSLLNAQGV